MVSDSPIVHKSVTIFSIVPWCFGWLFFRGNRNGVITLSVSSLDLQWNFPAWPKIYSLGVFRWLWQTLWLLWTFVALSHSFLLPEETKTCTRKRRFNFSQNMKGKKTLPLIWLGVKCCLSHNIRLTLLKNKFCWNADKSEAFPLTEISFGMSICLARNWMVVLTPRVKFI